MVVKLNPSESWQGRWLLWVYASSLSLGKMVTGWSSSWQNKQWVISADHQHTFILAKMASHPDFLDEKRTLLCCSCVDLLSRPFNKLKYVQVNQVHFARFQHCALFCCLLVLNPVLQGLTHKMWCPSHWQPFHLVPLGFLGPGPCLLPSASIQPLYEMQHLGVVCA